MFTLLQLMRARTIPLILGLFVLVGSAYGQTGSVEGQVTNAKTGDPIPGVSVVVEGLNVGAATDEGGSYEIQNVPTGEQVLRATFVGFADQQETIEVSANEVTEVYFQMRADMLGMDEVVVTGTGGAVEKKQLGNTISTLDAGELEENPIQSVSEMLQGREPGVQGLPSSGMTGQGSQIRIRGSASLSQSNEPVIYIDGVRANNSGGFGGLVGAGQGGTTSRLDDINPASIARVEILKGAAAATLYGSEASNGVIQIFTKRGEAGVDDQVTLSLKQGVSHFTTGRVRDQVGYARTAEQAQNMSNVFGRDISKYELVSQSALKDMFETGRIQTYTGSIRGGTDLITYYASGRFQTENGPLGSPPGMTSRATDEVTRGQANVNFALFPTENTQLRLSTAYSQMDFSTYQNSNNIYAPIELAVLTNPRYVTETNEYGNNVFATVEETLQQTVAQDVKRFTGSAKMNYKPIGMLSLDAVFGVDYTSTFSEEVRPFGWDVDNVTSATTEGSRIVASTQNLELSLDTKAILSNEFGEDFESKLTVGGQGFITRRTVNSTEGVSFPGPGFNVVSAASQITPQERFREVVQLGLFAQEQIGYREFVYTTVGGRLDANSAFGSNFDTLFYPKVSVSVVPSDLDAWGSGIGPVSSLRIRGAIGQSGLQPGAFDAITTYSSIVTDATGLVADNLGNENLKPEIATEWEIGTNIGFLQDQYSIDATYWNRTTNDALIQRQFSPTGGFRSSQLVNIGQTKGQGVELGLQANILSREDLSVNLFANAAYLWEQVTDIGAAPPIKAGGAYPRVRNYIVEGYAPGAHIGASLVETKEGFLPVDFNGDGEPDSRESVVQYLDGLSSDEASLPENTDVVLLKQEGGVPEISPPLDQYEGKPFPDWAGSFGFDLTFLGNFSVSTMFEYKAGNYHVNNLSGAFKRRSEFIGRNIKTAARVDRNFVTGGVNDNFTPQNDGEVRTQALETWLNKLLSLAPFSGLNHIEPADFIRWRELSVSYDLPSAIASKIQAEDVSLTLAGRNLKLWTTAGYRGVDPESNEVGRGGAGNQIDQNFRQGIEAWQVPAQRRITLELKATF